MLQRCYSPDTAAFKHYGGRGITVCDRWMDPWAFIADLGERGAGLSLGRIDNEGNYCPENCRWEDDFQQARNTRRTVHIGDQTQSEFASSVGLSESTIMRRRKRGDVLDKPAHFKRNKLDETQVLKIKALFATAASNAAIARQFNVSHTLIAQIRRGRLWVGVQAPECAALHTMAKLQMQQAAPTLEWE